MAKRFIPLTEVSEILDISSAQAYALVRSGELPAIKVGGRGQWRVETVALDGVGTGAVDNGDNPLAILLRLRQRVGPHVFNHR